MLLNQLQALQLYAKTSNVYKRKFCGWTQVRRQIIRLNEQSTELSSSPGQTQTIDVSTSSPIKNITGGEMLPTASTRVVPMVLTENDPIILPFDDVPGPSSLKVLAKARQYLTRTGTQITAGALTLGLNVGSFISNRKPTRFLSTLFDTYGPVVRFVSPVGGDIVLINNPEHIQNVFAAESEHPVRSMLDSLEKYRTEHRNNLFSGLYNLQGKEWSRHRNIISEPLHQSLVKNMTSLEHVCDNLANKIYNTRDCHDELTNDLYSEVHKWAYDCMGQLIFSKKFTMLDTEIVYSQCDISWLYRSLENATNAILKLESGMQLWKLFPTLSWKNLVKHCDTLDNLIGKYVLEAEQKMALSENLSTDTNDNMKGMSLINALLIADDKLSPEDITTVMMDMLLLGVNTVSTSMSFLMYYLARHQKVQRTLYNEIEKISSDTNIWKDMKSIKENTPYLQACIKETLRLVPPIPVLTRILPKNVFLDKYNIPRGTLIIMSTQDASLKESNFDEATRFNPDRWLKSDSKDYHAFASIPFGFGTRKCLGQNISEVMLTMMTYKIIQKYKLEYHYGDIEPTNTFIVKPNKPLKIRFIDRV